MRQTTGWPYTSPSVTDTEIAKHAPCSRPKRTVNVSAPALKPTRLPVFLRSILSSGKHFRTTCPGGRGSPDWHALRCIGSITQTGPLGFGSCHLREGQTEFRPRVKGRLTFKRGAQTVVSRAIWRAAFLIFRSKGARIKRFCPTDTRCLVQLTAPVKQPPT